jgi:mRNA-degrading endonuclease RelE of RelBE toxin-antitoxin system
MKCEVRTTNNFEKAAKPLLKKYKSLKKELIGLEAELIANPKAGTSLGHNVYKIRLAIKSKGKGKSGSARVITYLELEAAVDDETMTIYLLTIYNKSKVNSISQQEINKLIEERNK